MRAHYASLLLPPLVGALACGGSVAAPESTRWNFAVIDGRNQKSVAGDASLAKAVTSQLTRDPNGKFATRVLDLLRPAVAYAQGLALAGEPVANAIVCGRESAPGEPKVVPLCAFTLADGKAANTVEAGTKAGTFNILFTAQVPSEEPVVDSTTVVVEPGPADPSIHISSNDLASTVDTVPASAVVDAFGNPVPFAIQSDSLVTVAGTVAGTVDARRVTFKAAAGASNVYTPILDADGKKIATLDYSFDNTNASPVWRFNVWGLAFKP